MTITKEQILSSIAHVNALQVQLVQLWGRVLPDEWDRRAVKLNDAANLLDAGIRTFKHANPEPLDQGKAGLAKGETWELIAPKLEASGLLTAGGLAALDPLAAL